MRQNFTTERFARTSRDRNPISDDEPRTFGEKVLMIVSIVVALIAIGALIYANGVPS